MKRGYDVKRHQGSTPKDTLQQMIKNNRWHKKIQKNRGRILGFDLEVERELMLQISGGREFQGPESLKTLDPPEKLAEGTVR